MNQERVLAAYRASVEPLYAWVARRVGGDRALAEDVVQETWLRAVASWRRSGPPDDALAWLSTVAANLLRSHFARRRPDVVDRRALDLAREDFEPDGPDAAAALQWGLARLRAGQARLLSAFHLDGRSVADLAREHGSSERAIEGRLRRARLALRRHLAPHLENSGA